jgi:hypothetical protein
MKATLYQTIGIALAIASYLLDDHPRHIKYRENLNKSCPSSSRVQVQIPKPPQRTPELDPRHTDGEGESGQRLSATQRARAWENMRSVGKGM